jgi:hypothetical protein
MLRHGLSAGSVIVLLATSAATGVIYVDDDAPPGGDGNSWTTAFTFLRDALGVAQSGDEMHLAGGTYYPDRDAAHPVGTADRYVSFNLVSGVALYGGYAGLNLPSDPDQRDLELYPTTLSGNIGSPTNLFDNSYHVVWAVGTGAGTLLDGLTITAGNGYGLHGPTPLGGLGLYLSEAELTLRACSILDNVGAYDEFGYFYHAVNGAGIYASQSELNLIACRIAGNWAGVGYGGLRNDGSPGGDGGAIYATDSSLIRTVSTAFVDNRSGHGGHGNMIDAGGPGGNGGAVFIANSSRLEAVDCLFGGNQSGDGGDGGTGGYGGPGGPGGNGGDIFVDGFSSLSATNCLMTGAHAGRGGHGYGGGHGGDGGSVYTDSANVQLIACTMTGNSAGDGGTGAHGNGPLGHGGGLYCNNAVPVVTNSILWLVTPEAVAGQADITYSDVQGGWTGTGNISGDPLFVDADGPDNDPNTWADNDYRLLPGSPCIDAGENLSPPRDVYDLDGDGCVTEPLPVDLDGHARYVDDPNTPDTGNGGSPLVDMGAYEFPDLAAPPTIAPCAGDTNCDGLVNFDDINPFVLALSEPAEYQQQYPACFLLAADADNDGSVDFDDIDSFVALLSAN